MTQQIDEAFVTQTLQRLVRIDSRNPNMTPDGPGEAQVGNYIAGLLREWGLQVRVHDLGSGRVNVVGVLPGRGQGRILMLNGHMDTVGVDGMDEPFSGEIRDGRLYGRGSQDMKGSLAAMLGAVKALTEAGRELAGDLLLAFVADEEDRSLGSRDLVDHYRADAAVVTEPTEMDVVHAHRGLTYYQVETFGRAAHGSRFQEGVDAITHMGRFLAQLDLLQRDLPRRTPHPHAGPPSLHAGVIEGGTDTPTYPGHCSLTIDRRTVPGEHEEEVTAELQKIIDRLASEDDTFKAVVKPIMQRPPLETPADAGIIQALQDAFQGQLGRAPRTKGVAYWSDAALLSGAGMEAVLLGPVGEGLHTPEEWVDLASVHELARVLAAAAVRYCQPAGGEV